MANDFADRKSVFAYAKKKYKTVPDSPFREEPEVECLRHSDNRKWFALLMPIERYKVERLKPGPDFDPEDDEIVDVMNLKLDDEMLRDMLLSQHGFYPAYHMSRSKWISILLDGTVPFDNVANCIDISYEATASRQTLEKMRPPKEWLIPANPKYFDVEAALAESRVINWKQSSAIKPGDTIYMYMAAPVSAILYRFKAVKVDIPHHYHGADINIDRLMQIRLERRYKQTKFTMDRLRDEFGIRAVRGPRGVPVDLSDALRNR